jgi:hypothetical protein
MKLIIKGNEYVLENRSKTQRAIIGTLGPKGELQGGVGKEATPLAKITEYDRLGGYITCEKGGQKAKVKTGSFYDFKNKQARKSPVVVFVFRDIYGEEIELADGAEMPMSVLALKGKKSKTKAKVKTTQEIEEEDSNESYDDSEDEVVEDDEDIEETVEDDLQDDEDIEEVPVAKKGKGKGKK